MPTQEQMTPSVDDVALLLRTRTVGDSSGGLGGDSQATATTTFTDATRPTASEVEAIIATAYGSVVPGLVHPIAADAERVVRRAVAIYAAIQIELSFFRESVDQDWLDFMRGEVKTAKVNADTLTAGTAGSTMASLRIGTVFEPAAEETRRVVVLLWSGSVVARRLGPDDPDPDAEELAEIAAEYVAANDGVRPTVRVLEVSTAPTARSLFGPAGCVPAR